MHMTKPAAAGLALGSQSLLGACKHFFGLRPDQKSAIDFGKEYKCLTMQDRIELKEMLEKEQGYIIQPLAGAVPPEAMHGAAAMDAVREVVAH